MADTVSNQPRPSGPRASVVFAIFVVLLVLGSGVYVLCAFLQ